MATRVLQGLDQVELARLTALRHARQAVDSLRRDDLTGMDIDDAYENLRSALNEARAVKRWHESQ